MALINSDQSNAPLNPPATPQVSASQFQNGNNPQQVVNNQTFVGSLSYPDDRPKYFMKFEINNYSRKSLTEVGTLTPVNYPDGSAIILPMAQTLNDIHQVHWEDKFQVGTVPGMLLQGGAAAAQQTLQQNLNSLKNNAAGIIGALAGHEAEQFLGAGITGGAEALLGLSPNKFMTVLFIGPLYKRHSFNWLLSPRTPSEADSIRKIVKVFNNAMSPNMIAGGLVWAFPKIFKISIHPNTKYMYKFKPCVLETFQVNYTPAGRFAAYMDTGLGDNPPEGVILTMRFLELEYWLEGNFTDSSDPDDVYNQYPHELSAAEQGAVNMFNDWVQWYQNKVKDIKNNANNLPPDAIGPG